MIVGCSCNVFLDDDWMIFWDDFVMLCNGFGMVLAGANPFLNDE